MNWKVNEQCPATIDNGIVVDFTEGKFVMLLKDDVWSEDELHAFLHQKMHISFLYERVCALFFIEIVDGIEVSDASFDIHACEEGKMLIEKGDEDCYGVEIYLINKDNTICAQRKITLSKKASRIIYEKLQIQMETPYDEEGFNRALMKLQTIEEPFELVERSQVHEVFA